MAELTYEELTRLNQRLSSGTSTIEEEASRFTLDELAEGLRMTRGMLQALVDGWTQEQLQAQPPLAREGEPEPEDRWSATEALSHLIATQNWYLLHMGRLLGRREEFDLMPRGLGDHARQDVSQAELSSAVRTATERLLATIAGIPPDADLSAQRDSTFFGALSLRGWVMLAIIHDYQHLQQIQRLTELPDFPVAG